MSDLASIRTFPQLVKYLRDELDWPITPDDFEDLTFDYTPQELGIDSKSAAKIQEIKRLRSLSINQPWGVFFVKFEPKRLPIVALRRILSSVALKRRASANSAERKVWEAEDLLFISNYGEGDGRQMTFAHFSQDPLKQDLPTLKVLGWDNLDTPLHLDHVADSLRDHLHWPQDEADVQTWRAEWRQAFGLRYAEVVTTSRALAIRLAELARAIRNRIDTALEIETENGPLTTLMRAFREALVHDLDADGFADMYAQTIAYGLLSARIANPKASTADDLAEQMPVTNPFLKELMETFLQAGGRRGETAASASLDFDELGVSEVVDLLNHANMEAVIRDFGDRNPQEDPVIHFYELFLKEYDAQKRMQRGVFYTPRPVVSYIVRAVDDLLRSDFGLEDGLADTATWGQVAAREGIAIPVGVAPTDRFVNILDPATGTGTFLVEVIGVIRQTLSDKWALAGYSEREAAYLWNEYVPRELLPRLCGYELLMAPYAIAHLKCGLKLYETGYRFASKERARIFLTNALDPPNDFSGQFEFTIPALAREAEAVNEVKRVQHFTVVVGNPPYAGHSANNSVAWIVDKVHDYKRDYPDLLKPGQAKWLQDDYVKFFRLAQWVLTRTGCGVLSFISNHSYLANPTFRGMRESLLRTFPKAYFLDLHGNSKKKEVSPSGGIDQNVFEIQQGVAISRLVRSGRPEVAVMHGDLWGTTNSKLEWLAHEDPNQNTWSSVSPSSPQFLLAPVDADLNRIYQAGWSLKDVFSLNGSPAPGIVTTQDQFAIGFSREDVSEHVNALLATANEGEARTLFRLCTQNQWNYANAKKALSAGTWRDELVPIMYRPFDYRWTVFNSHVAVHRRERVMRHMLSGSNLGLVVTRSVEIGRGFEHVFCSRLVIQHHTVSLKEVNFLLPLFLEPSAGTMLVPEERSPNLAPPFLAALREMIGIRPDPEKVFGYIYAVLHSPVYRARYADFLKGDFPRIPLPGGADLFGVISGLGRELVLLHLVEAPAQRAIRVRFDPSSQSWACEHGDDIPVDLIFEGPEKPLVGKVAWYDDTVWLDNNAPGSAVANTAGATGPSFRGVSDEVWNFHIGGYQVCEKWLKDRKGRVLTADDIAHYQRIVVALHETIRIMGEIDEVIDGHGGWPNAFLVENTVPLPRQAF